MSQYNCIDIFTRLSGAERIEAVVMLIQNLNGIEEIDVALHSFDLQLKNTSSDSFADIDVIHNNLTEKKVKNVKNSYEFIHTINSTASKVKSLKDCTVKIELLKYSENKLDKDTYFIDRKPYIKQEGEFHRDRNEKNNSKQICNICGASIVGYHMSRHIKNLHTHRDEKRFSCQLCGKRFNLKEGLTYHEKRHNNIFKYSCDTCEYKTNKKSHFDRHVNAHLNIRPFSCPICKVKTGRKDNLKHHLRNKHKMSITKQEAFCQKMYKSSTEVSNDWKCNKCDYRTHRKSNLKTHIEGRHGGIYYPCMHCDYKTTWKVWLKRHAIKKHGEASYTRDADEVGIAGNQNHESVGSVAKGSHGNYV